MDKDQLIQILSTLHIDLDPVLLHQVVKFINSLSVPKEPQQPTRLYIIAAAAIRCQANQLKTVGGGESVRTGPSLEVFLRYTGAHQKQAFLDLLGEIAQQCPSPTKEMIAKINEIQRTYHIYLNYRKIFYSLAHTARLDKDITYSLMSILWIAYLKIKPIFTPQDVSDKQSIQKGLLLSVFRYFFLKIGTIDQQQINHIYKEQFNEEITLTQLRKNRYEEQYTSILLSAYQLRYKQIKQINWVSQIGNKNRLQRLADDFYNSHSRESQPYKVYQVNQLSYLEMNKTISPLARPHQLRIIIPHTRINLHQEQPMINISPPLLQGNLLFSDEEYSDDSNDSDDDQPVSPVKMGDRANSVKSIAQQKEYKMLKPLLMQVQEQIKEDKTRRNKFIIENSQTRMSVLKWIQDQIKIVDSLTQKEEKQFAPQPEYQTSRLQTLIKILEVVCVSCSDKQQRAKSIYKLFLSFLYKIWQSQSRESEQIQKSSQFFDSFLCATTILLNFAYRAQQMCFKQYCQEFKISVMSGYIPLNEIGLKGQLPKELEIFVFQLEERVLFQEIWKTDQAFELFSQSEHTYNQMVIIKRIFKHIHFRIHQIYHQQPQTDQIQLYKSIEQLIYQQISILRYNNLYAFLIASFIYFYGKSVSFDRIVEHFRKNQKYVSIHLQFKDGLGNQISFEDYYERYYQRQIYNMSREYYTTPIKLPPKTTERYQRSTEKSASFTQKYMFGVDTFSKSEDSPADYRKGLVDIFIVNSVKKSQDEEEDDEEEDDHQHI